MLYSMSFICIFFKKQNKKKIGPIYTLFGKRGLVVVMYTKIKEESVRCYYSAGVST
jgi:hypothetical protein